ncbi:HAD hydrolase-like protein [Candidatus Woesearchaeota archaeon]|nr:HAD hydrolase-like protein [Candidatus Woesearchaeota archaeon]
MTPRNNLEGCKDKSSYIIFDVDGTLYDKSRVYNKELGSIMDSHLFLRYATYFKLKSSGKKNLECTADQVISEYNEHICNKTLLDAIKHFPEDMVKEYLGLVKRNISNGNVFVNEFGASRDYLARILGNIDFRNILVEDQRLQETIHNLKNKKCALGILTNEVYSTIEKVFEVLGLEMKDFKLETGTEYPIACKETGVSKPDIESFRHLLELNHIKPENSTYIGDSISKDIKPSLEAGMLAVLVNYESEEPIMSCAEYKIINSIYELDNLF